MLYGKVEPDAERLDFLDGVYDRGCLNWDTAEGYADSEELIGKWFARSGKRKEVRDWMARRSSFLFILDFVPSFLLN